MALTVYKSSAGSGKTFTLVKEYIKLLIANPQDYRHILAITFTNKATEEMKSRILRNLEELASGETSDLEKVLVSEFEGRFDASQVAARANEAYDLIIHNYSRFEVSTIDSFFSRVLKSFARELNLPLSYEVEMNTEIALSETIDNLFRELDDQPEIKNWLTQYSKDQVENDKSWNVDQQIQKLGKNLFKEEFQDGFNDQKVELASLKNLIESLKKEIKTFENTAKSFANKAFEVLSQNGLTVTDFHFGKSGAIAAFYALDNADFEIDTKKRFLQTLDGEMQWGAKKSPNFELACQLGESDLHYIGTDALAFVTKERKHYNTAKAILKNIYAFGLLESLHQKLKDYRDEHNVMLISDTNIILKEVLREADAPFIFEKLGSFYKHIMIDEFQDTSNFQWFNLKPLIINALSEGHEVLIVGDVKQSIYRFRGGNMRLLLSQIKEELGLFYPNEADRNLSDNYRSLSEIVNFNNALFDRLPAALRENDSLTESNLFELAFEGHAQDIKKQKGGFVNMKFFEAEGWKDLAIDNLVENIRQNQDKKYGLKDMLILVNRNSEISDVANRLMLEQIPFINGDSLKLQQSDLVMFVLELLGYLQSGKDEVQTLSLIILFKRLTGQDFSEAFLTSKKQRLTLEEAGFPPEFTQQIHSLKQQSLFDLVCELLIIFDLKENTDIYLQQLLDLVLEQTQKGRNSIASFLEWWEKEGENQTVSTSEQTNAIRILSIHKSKGLESPIVFIPFTSWDLLPRPTIHQFWTKHVPSEYAELKYIPLDFSKKLLTDSYFENEYYKEAEESALDILNKTYVAFTRPREKLYLSAPQTKSGTAQIHQLMIGLLEEAGLQKSEESDFIQFSLGEDHVKVGKAEAHDASEVLKIYPATSFLDQLTIRNDSDRFFMLQETEQAKNITLGNQVHDVLSEIRVREDLPTVLRQRLQSGEMSREVVNQVEERIEKLFTQEQIGAWFSDEYEVYNERSIWFEGREHQPDRLLFKGNEAVVIDYKKEIESESHHAQVQRYMRAIQAMGFEKVFGYLIYVEPVLVKEVKR